MLTDLKLHLYRKLYLCNDSDEAQLCALALLPYQVDFIKASIVRVKELIRLMIHWFKTSFANPTEENKYVTHIGTPCEPSSCHVPFLSSFSSHLFREAEGIHVEGKRGRRGRAGQGVGEGCYRI